MFFEEGKDCEGFYDFGYVAQGHPQAEKLFETFCKFADPLTVARRNKGQDRWCELRPFGTNRGARFHAWSGEKDALSNIRGVRLNRLGVDEAGFCHRDVIPVCGPMLGTRNGKSVYVGTARRGGIGFAWFKAMFDRGMAKEAGYVSFNAPSECNPFSPPGKIAFLRQQLRDPSHPTIATPEEIEEFSGAFLSDLGACFRNLDACMILPFATLEPGTYVGVDAGGFGLKPVPDRRYVIGVDWGRKDDRTVFSVFDRESRDQVLLRIEPTLRSYEEYVGHLSALKHRYNDALIIGDDRGAGEYANSRLSQLYGDRYRGISITGQGESSKGGYVARMKDLFDTGSWRFLKVPVQVEEFTIYEQKPMGETSNGFTYSAPKNKHDDIVSAAMFASTVLQIAPRLPRLTKPPPEALSPAWFQERQRQRRAMAVRRGL